MGKLSYEAAVALARSSGGTLAHPGSVEAFDSLLNAGLITEKNQITDAGKSLRQKLKEKEEELKTGVDVSRRTRIDPKAALQNGPWFIGKVSKREVVTNGEVLYVGKPLKSMKVDDLEGDRKQKVHSAFHSMLKGSFIELTPTMYQVTELGGLEIVWLENKKAKVSIALQAKYFDFLTDKFPKGSFFGISPNSVVLLKVKNKGIKGVSGIVMPYNVSGVMTKGKAHAGR
jgi:hypothetical protein